MRTPGTYKSAIPLGAQQARKPRMPGRVLNVSSRRTSARRAASSQSSLRQLLLPLTLTFAMAEAALTILRPSVEEGVVNVHANPVRAWSSTASQPTPALSSGNTPVKLAGADPGAAAETRADTSRRARARDAGPRATSAEAPRSGSSRGACGADARLAAEETRPRAGPAEAGAARPADVRSRAQPARMWARVGARRAPRRAAGACAADADMTAREETGARVGVRGGDAREPLGKEGCVAQPTPMRRRRVVQKAPKPNSRRRSEEIGTFSWVSDPGPRKNTKSARSRFFSPLAIIFRAVD